MPAIIHARTITLIPTIMPELCNARIVRWSRVYTIAAAGSSIATIT